MTLTSSTRLNDVDLGRITDLAQAIQGDPAKARTTWAAHVIWDGGFASKSRVRGFAPTSSDEPAALGGGDTAPNPVEQLLGALGNCLAVGYAANASAAGIELRDLQIELQGDVDLHVFLGLSEGHAGFSSISASVRIDSSAGREEIDHLHARVLDSSPVGHTLKQAVPVNITLAP